MKSIAPVVLVLSCPALAQGVTVSALAPIPCIAASGPVVQTSTLPAGPMAINGFVTATAAQQAFADLSWGMDASDILLHVELHQRCGVLPGGTSGNVGPVDVRLLLSAPQPALVTVHPSKVINVPAGVPAPLLRVDVGDDGTFEFTEATVGQLSAYAQIGPSPLPVRILMDMALTTPGWMTSSLYVDVRPRTGMFVHDVLGGCAYEEFFAVHPTFAGGLNAYVQTFTASSTPTAVLFGLGVQPLFLGVTHAPCIVLPTPDLALLVTPTMAWTPVVTLPPGIGPLALWTQGVVISPAGLTTTAAYRVDIP